MAVEEQIESLRQLYKQWRIPPPEKVEKLDRGNGLVLDYMGHATITDILLEHDPAWTWRPMAHTAEGEPVVGSDAHGNPVLWGWLTVHGVTRPAVGTCKPKAQDPMKELVGDLLRNGAMRFGIGLSLWSKDEWQAEGTTAAKKTTRATKAKPEEAAEPTTPAAPPAEESAAEPDVTVSVVSPPASPEAIVERVSALTPEARTKLRDDMAEAKVPETIASWTAKHVVWLEEWIQNNAGAKF